MGFIQIMLSDVGVRFILVNRQLQLETGMETRAVHDNRDTVDLGGEAGRVWPLIDRAGFFVTHSRDVMMQGVSSVLLESPSFKGLFFIISDNPKCLSASMFPFAYVNIVHNIRTVVLTGRFFSIAS